MIDVTKSNAKGKKYTAELPSGKKVHFGAKGYQDYTQHGDTKRRESYLARHRPNQDWSKGGVGTAGFWARHLLWEKPSIRGAARALASKGLQVSIK